MHAAISTKVHTLLSKVKILTPPQKQEDRIAALQDEIETLQRELGSATLDYFFPPHMRTSGAF